MISSGLYYFLSILGIIFIFMQIKQSLYKYIPLVVVLYISVMIMALLGLWDRNIEINLWYKETKAILLPALIFLFMANTNFNLLKQLKYKLWIAFFSATFSLYIGFYTIYLFTNSYFDIESSKFFATLMGSWMGGTANMLAIGESININESLMGAVLITDSINYSFWVSFLLLGVGVSKYFNRWSGADVFEDTIEIKRQKNNTKLKDIGIFLFGIIVAFFIQKIAFYFPHISWLSQTTIAILLATFTGIIASFLPSNIFKTNSNYANILLYILIALIASRSQIEHFDNLLLFVLSGTAILTIHAILMLIMAKLFKLDLFIISVASLAHIGGIASAPILAATYSKQRVSIGIIMAIMGYLIGTFVGLFFAYSIS
jgi:uncharacterized membrane protein